MSNLITDWRVAVQDYLAAQFPAADVRGGRYDSVNRTKQDIIVVWWPGWPALQRDIALANPTLMIRYMPKLSKQPNRETPYDRSALEQAAADVMVAMQPMRKAGDFTDGVACYVASAIPNDRQDEWWVDFVVQGYAQHLAGSPA